VNGEDEHLVVDTGAGGASLFGFLYVPPDEITALKKPLRYGNVEIALADQIVSGIITRIEDVPTDDAPGGTAWQLTIATDADLSRTDPNNIAVRLLT
jgi:hypothetical protein